MQHCWPTTPNIVECYCTCCIHLIAHPYCLLLRVVESCCAQFETNQSFEPTTPNISFRNNVGFIYTALPTLLGPFTHITHGSQSLMGCILHTQCTADPNIVGSCCVHLHTTANMDTTTPNIVDLHVALNVGPQ